MFTLGKRGTYRGDDQIGREDTSPSKEICILKRHFTP